MSPRLGTDRVCEMALHEIVRTLINVATRIFVTQKTRRCNRVRSDDLLTLLSWC